VISSNCLEHIANPLKALTEWIRIIKPGGLILLVLPDKETNFDHNRPITTLGHLIDDYHRNVGEEDLTHLQEILELHDLPMDPPAGTYEDFKARSLLNLENRALHHHVFNISLLRDICEQIHLRILLSSKIKSDNMVLAIKGSGLLPPTVRFYYYRMLLSYYHRRKNI
jgi:SAM-dependent methyltransferase